jgi:Zn finger protein HypA/HybF involved in hydrogenase expression
MGSRSKTGNKKKNLENTMAQQAALILRIPDKCKDCGEPFDKKNKMMVMTWFVEVFNEQKRIDLFCPKCQDRRKDVQGNSSV